MTEGKLRRKTHPHIRNYRSLARTGGGTVGLDIRLLDAWRVFDRDVDCPGFSQHGSELRSTQRGTGRALTKQRGESRDEGLAGIIRDLVAAGQGHEGADVGVRAGAGERQEQLVLVLVVDRVRHGALGSVAVCLRVSGCMCMGWGVGGGRHTGSVSCCRNDAAGLGLDGDWLWCPGAVGERGLVKIDGGFEAVEDRNLDAVVGSGSSHFG